MILYKELSFVDLLPDKNKPIVDVGCGDGRVSKWFYDAGYTVIGIDMQQDKLDEAKKAMPNATFICGDIRTAEIPDGFLIFKNSLQFLDSKQQVEEILMKYSKNDMYISLFGKEDEKSAMALWWTREEVDELMKKLGNIKKFTETIGVGSGLLKKTRQSHTFEIIRLKT